MIFSPTATVTASHCLRRWNLSRQGVKATLIGYPDLCAMIGDGVAAGLEVYNRTRMTAAGPVETEGAAREYFISTGQSATLARLEWELEHGRRINLPDRPFADTLTTRVRAALELFFTHNPTLTMTITDVERAYPEYGHARPDLIGSDAQGPFILDYKVKMKLAPEWKNKELEKYRASPNQYHYAWMTGIPRFYICLIVLAPRPYVHLEPYTIAPAYGRIWHRDAAALWERMEQAKTLPVLETPGALQHSTIFGECEYAKACLECHLDPTRMLFDYVTVPRRERT